MSFADQQKFLFMALYQFEDKFPHIHDQATCWIAPTASVIGAVTISRHTSIWFGAVLRGDNEPIVIGQGSNVQENVVMHTDPGFPLSIGEGCTIGHQAMLHGCTIQNHSLIGMGATILNGAIIGANCLVGAHTLVPEDKSFPSGSLILGTPGKVVRALTPEEISGLGQSAATYRDKIPRYQTGLTCLDD